MLVHPTVPALVDRNSEDRIHESLLYELAHHGPKFKFEIHSLVILQTTH